MLYVSNVVSYISPQSQSVPPSHHAHHCCLALAAIPHDSQFCPHYCAYSNSNLPHAPSEAITDFVATHLLLHLSLSRNERYEAFQTTSASLHYFAMFTVNSKPHHSVQLLTHTLSEKEDPSESSTSAVRQFSLTRTRVVCIQVVSCSTPPCPSLLHPPPHELPPYDFPFPPNYLCVHQ